MCIWKGPGRLPQNLGPNCHYHPLKPFLLWNHEENHSRTHVFTEDLWQFEYNFVFCSIAKKTQTAMKGAPWGALPFPLAAPWTSLRTTWARIGRHMGPEEVRNRKKKIFFVDAKFSQIARGFQNVSLKIGSKGPQKLGPFSHFSSWEKSKTTSQ